MDRLIFLDRDGTVIKDYKDKEWQTVECIKPINKKLLKFLDLNNFTIIFISNQYLVEEGYLSKKKFDILHLQFIDYLEKIKLQNYEIKYALCDRKKNDYSTKPNGGMVLKYMVENELSDFRNIVYIGDSKDDKKMADHLQIKFFNISVLDEEEVIEQLKKIYNI